MRQAYETSLLLTCGPHAYGTPHVNERDVLYSQDQPTRYPPMRGRDEGTRVKALDPTNSIEDIEV